VNQLRQLTIEELQRRNFAATPVRTYLHGVTHFSRYFRRPTDQLGPEDIRKYQAMLFIKLKYGPNTVILRLTSLRFFYIHGWKRNWSIAETPYPKKLRQLLGVLSQQEVARLIEAADTPFHRILRAAFCQQRGLAVGTLDKYRQRVHGGRQAGGRAFVPVEVVPSTARDLNGVARRDGALVVELRSGRRIEVCRGFDAGTLELLLTILDRV